MDSLNIHPIFVHFPVAFLSIYAILELIRFRKIMDQPYWFYVKAVMVIFGALGAHASFLSGKFASLATGLPEGSESKLLEQHEFFALATVILFSVVAAGYAISWISRQFTFNFIAGSFKNKLWVMLSLVSSFILRTPVIIVLSLVGLAFITITGGLGGIMVHGSEADPFFGAVYKMFFE